MFPPRGNMCVRLSTCCLFSTGPRSLLLFLPPPFLSLSSSSFLLPYLLLISDLAQGKGAWDRRSPSNSCKEEAGDGAPAGGAPLRRAGRRRPQGQLPPAGLSRVWMRQPLVVVKRHCRTGTPTRPLPLPFFLRSFCRSQSTVNQWISFFFFPLLFFLLLFLQIQIS